MTTLREAATQALEALEDFGMKYYENTGEVLHRDVYESLKSALVEDAMQKFTDVNQELEAALAEPVQEPVAFDHGIGADRFRVVRGAYWWHVLIGESTAKHGKFHTQAGAEEMAALLLREFRNGAFVQHKAAPPQRKPLTEEEIDGIWDSEKAFADIYAIARAIERAHGIDGAPEERHFCPRCGKRTNGIHTCTPPAPLTDEVIADLWHQNGGFHHHFARAIERWLRGHA